MGEGQLCSAGIIYCPDYLTTLSTQHLFISLLCIDSYYSFNTDPQIQGMRIHAHCKEILIYVFPEKELRGLSPNFPIFASVSDLYIPMIGPPISCSRIRKQIAQRTMNVRIATVAAHFLF